MNKNNNQDFLKSNTIKVCAFLFISLFHSYCWCMDKEDSSEESKVVRIIKYENFQKEDVNFLDQCLKNLLKFEDGRKLISCLINCIELSTKKIATKDKVVYLPNTLYIRSSEKQAFKDVEKEKRFVIGLNLSELDTNKKLKTPCLGKYVSDEEFISIGSSCVPFYIVLGHEFLHVLHYLVDPITYLKDSRDCSSQYWPIYYALYKKEDVEEVEKHIERIWKDAEEQKTIIGESTSNFFPCEFTLRVQSLIMPRYAYQSAHDNFLEDRGVIDTILLHHEVDPKNLLLPEDFSFNEEIAVGSYLNSLKYKKCYSKFYNEKLIHEPKQELNEQQKKRLEFLKKKAEERKTKK